jgi:hypothetical protein
MNQPVAFHDLKAEQYPLTIALMDVETGEELWRETVAGPGVIQIPAMAPRKVLAWICFPDGVAIQDPWGNAWYLTPGAVAGHRGQGPQGQ